MTTKLPRTLHMLLHLAEHGGPMTSQELAECTGLHPVQVRRTLAGLRRMELIDSTKGRGGGWRFSVEPAQISLRDVHLALGDPSLLSLALPDEAPRCLVARAVAHRLSSACQEAEQLLLERLASISLGQIAADFHQLLEAAPSAQKAMAHRSRAAQQAQRNPRENE